MKDSNQLSLIVQTRLRDADDIYTSGTSGTITLWHLIEDFRGGQLILPAHQREQSWPPSKIRDYIHTLCYDAAPPGSFEIYHTIVNGKQSVDKLNDGVQRLLAAIALLDDPARFGLTSDEAIYVLRNASYPVRHKTHRNESEALNRFHQVNSGIPLTPYQFTRGTILYCQGEDKSADWNKWLEELQRIIEHALIKVTHRSREFTPSTKRYLQLLHKSYRQTTSMFQRYVLGDQYGIEYEVSRDIVDPHNFFEQDLAKHLADAGLMAAKDELEKFRNIINAEAAMIEAEWNSTKPTGSRKSIRPATVRWLLDLSILRRNKRIPVPPWQDFVHRLLAYNEGATEVIWRNKEGKDKRTGLSFGRLRQVTKVADILQSPLKQYLEKGREQPSEQLEDGWQHSHRFPYSTHGNGETFPELAIVNLSRGAKIAE